MANELIIGKKDTLSLISDNPLGELIKPLSREILLFDSYVAGTSYIKDESVFDDIKEGDEVILMGTDGVNTILADDIGSATGTINYEICCAFGQRLPKVYIE